MKKSTGFYPRLVVDADGGSAVSQAGGVLLTSTIRAAGLDVALREALAPWRAQLARHDPAKVLLNLAMTLALGGTPVRTWPRCAPSRRCSGRWDLTPDHGHADSSMLLGKRDDLSHGR